MKYAHLEVNANIRRGIKLETRIYELKKTEEDNTQLNSVNDIIAELNQTNLKMDKIRSNILSNLEQQELLNKQLDEIKSFVWKDILEAKTEDGKNIYTNDKARDIAKTERLQNHKGYKELTEKYYNSKTEIAKLENNLIFQKNKFRILIASLEVQ